MRPGWRLAAAAGGASRAGRRAAGGGLRRCARGWRRCAAAGGDQQVGLLVRTVPCRVRRLSARVGRPRARGGVPRHRLRRHARGASSVPALSRSATRATTTAAASARRSDHRLQRHAGDGLLSTAAAGRFIHQGPYPSVAKLEARHRALRAGRAEAVPELRIDPLSGHRTIVAGERSRRPGGEPTLRAGGADRRRARPVRRGPRGPHAAGAVRAAPDGGPPGRARVEGARGAEPLSGARRPRTASAAPARSTRAARAAARRSCSSRCPRPARTR